jgi:hypothetical protein
MLGKTTIENFSKNELRYFVLTKEAIYYKKES